jgi:hypothetical protein
MNCPAACPFRQICCVSKPDAGIMHQTQQLYVEGVRLREHSKLRLNGSRKQHRDVLERARHLNDKKNPGYWGSA